MNEYVFSADLLNKFSQLTPWVQAVTSIALCGMLLGIAYFVKESIALIMQPLIIPKPPKPEKEWKDKYYRG